jgi:glutathione peroxidase
MLHIMQQQVTQPASLCLYDFSARTLDGEEISLAVYRGKVALIVNVASQCGFTSQYEGLEKLYSTHRDTGLVVLGFPCNQFGHQEPGTEAEIREFCTTRYAVTFPMFAKVEVNGPGTLPLYAWLKSQARGLLGTQAIKWNFTKFLADRSGQLVGRFAPNTTPAELEEYILPLL